jgi:hypothetical protein
MNILGFPNKKKRKNSTAESREKEKKQTPICNTIKP